jgi:hypothetical protein
MIEPALETEAARIREKKRIRKQDVQKLRRDVLPDGLATREEAEVLIALDREATIVHASWPAFFIATLTDFVVWGLRPTGYVDPDIARWLSATLLQGEVSPRAMRLIREVIREAQAVDAALLSLPGDEPAMVPCAPAEASAVELVPAPAPAPEIPSPLAA